MVKKSLLNDTPYNLIHQYHQALIAAGIPIEQMILFGSYAKKTPSYDSDLDVAVVSKTFGKSAFYEMVKLAKIAATIDFLIEPHPYHPKDLKDKWDPLAREIMAHGIKVI